jgi:hypothetical protein
VVESIKVKLMCCVFLIQEVDDLPYKTYTLVTGAHKRTFAIHDQHAFTGLYPLS